jgi:hypothetical protein
MKTHVTLTLFTFSFLAIAGCGAGDQPTTSGAAPQAAALTFWQDVAPIVQQRCLSCHSEGGIGPFRLDRYENARVRAPLIAAAVKARTMPPWSRRAAISPGNTCAIRGSPSARSPFWSAFPS